MRQLNQKEKRFVWLRIAKVVVQNSAALFFETFMRLVYLEGKTVFILSQVAFEHGTFPFHENLPIS